ncbi:MAG: gliding motility lipoprotein GldH [Bacteroidota bacterium]
MRNFWILTIVLFSFACGNNYVYEKKIEIPSATWQYDNDITYEFEIEDIKAKYNLYLDVTHSDQFESQNFYTMIHTTYPSGRTVDSQISIELADKLGQWHGKCNSEECQLRIVLQQGTFFKEQGLHQIVFEQYTRQESLKGIKALAFSVEQVE